MSGSPMCLQSAILNSWILTPVKCSLIWDRSHTYLAMLNKLKNLPMLLMSQQEKKLVLLLDSTPSMMEANLVHFSGKGD